MRTLRKLVLLLILASASSNVFAGYPGMYARSNDMGILGVFFSGSYGFGMMRVGDFKEFADSYNSFYGPGGQDILDSELKPFRTCSGYSFGGGIHVGPMSFSLSYVEMRSTSEVDIKGGNKRVFTHVLRIPARIGIGFDNRFVQAEFTTGFGSPYIMAGYQYYDGTMSYGRERTLNGIYRATCFTFGLNVMGKIPFAKIFAVHAGFAVDGFWGFEYEDINWNKIFSNYPQYFPTDLAEWNANPAGYPIEKSAQAGGFGLYVYGGLTVQIN